MLTLLLSVALTALLGILLFRRNANRSRLVQLVEQIPGPPSFPVVGSMLKFVTVPRNRLMAMQLESRKTYGPISRVWLGPHPVVFLTLPRHVEVLLRDTKYLDKAFIYTFLHPWLGTGLLTSTGEKWHSHRKMITPTFHFNILDNFVEVFSEKSRILVNKLQREVGTQGFDMYPYITKCALDIICETAMGTLVNAQDEVSSEYVTAIYDMSELSLRRIIRPWLYADMVYRLTRAGKRTTQCLKILHSFTEKVIKERKSLRPREMQVPTKDDEDGIGKKKRIAFLDMLLESPLKLSDEELREEVDTFMFEGHDTTSAGICWTLFLLGQHMDMQQKVYEELENIFQASDRSPTMKDLNDMKYLERVIKETLRLYPSVPSISRLLKEDLDLGDYKIPAGCSVAVQIYTLHRNPEQFPDPEKFDPDNFLPERVAKRHPYAYIPFSAGPRNCIGQKFALLEEKTVLSYVLRHYKVRSLDKMEDINLMPEIILRPEKGVRFVITPRR